MHHNDILNHNFCNSKLELPGFLSCEISFLSRMQSVQLSTFNPPIIVTRFLGDFNGRFLMLTNFENDRFRNIYLIIFFKFHIFSHKHMKKIYLDKNIHQSVQLNPGISEQNFLKTKFKFFLSHLQLHIHRLKPKIKSNRIYSKLVGMLSQLQNTLENNDFVELGMSYRFQNFIESMSLRPKLRPHLVTLPPMMIFADESIYTTSRNNQHFSHTNLRKQEIEMFFFLLTFQVVGGAGVPVWGCHNSDKHFDLNDCYGPNLTHQLMTILKIIFNVRSCIIRK